MKYLVIVVGLIFSYGVYATQNAVVKVVKGKVTKLAPGTKIATKLKKGDKLAEDTSIVTGSRSFARITFADKTTMNIGPKSMIVIHKMQAKKANMVNLLTGMIKAKVQKNSQKTSKTKMLIKTRSAVMGVRGTKFQSTYNPINNSTSLVTVEGKVAMVKVKQAPPEIIEKAVSDSTNKSSKSMAKKSVNKVQDDVDQLDKLLETSKDTVEVPAGRYAGVVEKMAKPTVPVKIAPKQYNAIAKSMGSKKRAKDVMKRLKSDPKPEGSLDKATGKLTPKAGGFVDFATGIYVAPTKAAVLDKKTGTFKDNSIGKVNNKTGAYIPPKGIKLDAKKGFVVDTKKSAKIASTSDKKKLQKTLASLNQGVKKQIVVNKVESKPMKQLTSNWLPKNHILSAEFRPYSEILTVKNKNEGSSSDFYTSSASWILFTWQQDWSEKWSSRLKFGAHVYEIDDSISNSDNSSSKVSINEDGGSDGPAYLSVGAVYKYSKKWTFLGELVMREVYYVVPDGGSSSGDSNLRKDSSEVGSIDLGAEYFVGEWKNLILTAGGIIHIIGTEEVPSASGGCFGTNTNCDYREEADMFGFALSFDAHYQWKTNMGVTSSLWYDSIDADADSISYTRNSIGVGFDFIWDI